MKSHLPMAIEPSIPFNQCQFKLFQVDKNSLFCKDLLVEVNHKLIESTIAYFLGLDITKVEAMAVTNIDLNYAYARNCMFGLTLEQVQHLFATTHNVVANKYKPILSELIVTKILPLFNDTTKHDDFKKEIDVNIIATNQPLTMSSREIAELLETRHADVCRTIERLIDKHVIEGYTPMAYTHPQNKQQYEEYHINKRDSYVVVAQLSPEFTAKVVDRWQELENATTPQIEHKPEPRKSIGNASLVRLALKEVHAMKLSEESKQVVIAHLLHDHAGLPLNLMLPEIKSGLSPEQIAQKLGTNSNVVGRIISTLGIRGNDEYCTTILNKAAHSDKQVPQHLYNNTAVDMITKHFKERTAK